MRWHDSGTWVWMAMMMLVFWSLVVFGVMMLFRRTRPSADIPVGDAKRLLDERFARGDIDEDHYARSRDLLRAEH